MMRLAIKVQRGRVVGRLASRAVCAEEEAAREKDPGEPEPQTDRKFCPCNTSNMVQACTWPATRSCNRKCVFAAGSRAVVQVCKGRQAGLQVTATRIPPKRRCWKTEIGIRRTALERLQIHAHREEGLANGWAQPWQPAADHSSDRLAKQSARAHTPPGGRSSSLLTNGTQGRRSYAVRNRCSRSTVWLANCSPSSDRSDSGSKV